MITETEYKLLKVFPADKSKAPLHTYAAKYNKIEFKGTILPHVVTSLVGKRFLQKENNSYSITDEGLDSIKEYEMQFHRKNEIEDLTYKKLGWDTKNAERVYKSYPITRLLAWIGAISGVVALVLKLLELLGIWPKSK